MMSAKRTELELSCRYFFPGTLGRDWAWQRHQETLHLDIPTQPGQWVHQLPPPFFGYNAALPWRLDFLRQADGVLKFCLQSYGYIHIPWTEWRESSLWSEVKFNPNADPGVPNHRGPWWFRYRTPGAQGFEAKVAGTLTEILDHADDPFMITQFVSNLRREMILNALGRPTT